MEYFFAGKNKLSIIHIIRHASSDITDKTTAQMIKQKKNIIVTEFRASERTNVYGVWSKG